MADFSIKTYFQLLEHDIEYVCNFDKKHQAQCTMCIYTFICSVIELNVSTRISITLQII